MAVLVLAAGVSASARAGASGCLTGANDVGANLSGRNLSGCNLTGFNLTGANLQGSNLSKAVLSGAELDGANLSGANLSEAILTGVSARNATFTGANLSKSVLTSAGVSGANFNGANLSDVDLTYAHARGATFVDANLSRSAFDHADFSDVDFTGANSNQSTCAGTIVRGWTGTRSCAGQAATVPGAPTGVSVAEGFGSATVSFSAPPNGGTPITGYTVTATPGGLTASGSSSPLVVTGLAGGVSYTFKVVATNSAGTGPASAGASPPVVSVPADKTVEATGPAGAFVLFTVSATDPNDPFVAVLCSASAGPVSSPAGFPLGTTTVTCKATDAHGNSDSESFKVTVRDTTPPLVTVPAAKTVEATGPAGAAVSFAASAADLVDGPLTPTCSPASGSTFPLGTSTVNCKATDTHGNTGTASFKVTVRDTTPPLVTVPAAKTVEATGPAGAAVSFAASAADLVDGPLTPTCSPASGSTFPLGTSTVNCKATDTHGNTGTASFKVTVQDTTPPLVTVPAAKTVEATGPGGAVVSFTASGSDLVDGPLAASCSPASGSTFPLGATTVTCTATDAHGNTGSATFTVTVQNTTPPVVSVPADKTVEATGPDGAALSFTASGSDLADEPLPASCSPASGSTFPLGATTVTCTATDAHGNTGSASFTVTVQDTIPPVVSVPADKTVEATGPDGATVSFAASATDLVDGPLAASCVPVGLVFPASVFPLGTTEVTCSATDAHGNAGTASFTVTVQDTTPPAVTVPADKTVEATGPDGAALSFTASGSDLVDGPLTPACSPASASTFPLGATTVTCTATDAHGNTGTASFTVTVQDTTPPAVTVPADKTVEATGPDGAAVSYSASASDLVDGPLTASCSPTSGSTFPLGATTVTCSATDAHGNTGSASFTVTVQDTTPPVVSVPADKTIEATGPAGATVSYSASASDLVDGPLAASCVPIGLVFPASVFPLGTTEVTCSATDAHGNTGSTSFTVTAQDTTPPVVTVPADKTVEATGPTGAAVSFTASGSDLVDGPLTPNCSPASGSTFPLGPTSVTCSATDAHGNTGSASFTVTVQDTTPPVVSVPADKTIEATGPDGAALSFTTSASDLVDGPLPPSCSPASGSTFPLGATTVTCSATDAHGNTGTSSFTVTVQDTTPPVVSVPADKTIEATGPDGAALSFTASGSDLVDGPLAPSCSPASGSTFPLGATTVTCSATDAHHNTGSASFTVTVQDTTPPVVSVPADKTLEATGSAGAAVSYSASASDLVDGPLAASCVPVGLVFPASVFPLGTTEVTCSATDAHGNTGTASFTVTVQDTTPPVVSVPADKTVEATGPAGAALSFAATASDLVDGPLTPTCSPLSGSTFPLGATTVTCSATDAHGNTGTASFTVTVQDTTPPVVSVPTDKTVEATGPAGAAVSFTATASDLVDGPLPTSCSPASGSTFPLGATTVTCTATDAHGNTGSATFTVTVQDTTPPAVTVPADKTVEATGPAGAAPSFTASGSDLVDGPLPASCAPTSGSTFPLGATTVTCTATDAHGNTGTAAFTVTVQDTTPPAITVPADKTVEATGPTGAAVSYSASASDLVDGPVTPGCSPASGSTLALDTTTKVTCSATDAHGNTGTASFTIKVVDTTPPAITVPADKTVEATGPTGAAVSFTASGSDLVDGPLPASCSPASGSTFPLGATTVTCSATDAHGNTGTASFTVTVQDTTPPVVTVPADKTVEATGPDGAAPSFTASGSDLVDGPLPASCSPASGSTFPLGATTVTCTATDAHTTRAARRSRSPCRTRHRPRSPFRRTRR